MQESRLRLLLERRLYSAAAQLMTAACDLRFGLLQQGGPS